MCARLSNEPTANFEGSADEWSVIRRQVEHLIVSGLEFVLARADEAYPFIDTKFDLRTGEDFTDSLRGRGAIYTWIQGRGLEALSVHLRWLEEKKDVSRSDLIASVRGLVERVATKMEGARAACGGLLPFLMSPDGTPLAVESGGGVVPDLEWHGNRCTLSDLFYAKGLLAAGDVLAEPAMMSEAKALLQSVVDDLRSGRFAFGQLALDPKNPVTAVAGRNSYAGQMIGIGAATLFYRLTGEAQYRDIGLEFINHILQKHAGEKLGFREGDICEFITVENAPWKAADGRVWSDPGHATEFVGLAMAHLMETKIDDRVMTAKLATVLRRNFANGFAGRGIVKAYDLVERRPINSEMPWWSLPETMRAAALVAQVRKASGDDDGSEWEAVFIKCWRAFTENFVRPDRGFLAWQCLDAEGNVSSAIPATPDLDPAYHTGLSLLGCLPWLAGKAREEMGAKLA